MPFVTLVTWISLQCDELKSQLVTLQHIDNQYVKSKCDE